MRKRVLSICLILALCLTLLPVSALAAEGDPVYLALGDSITTGYAPPASGSTEPGKVERPFADQVEVLGYDLTNLAEDGETSTSLLAKLKNGNINVSSADLITITIGGNDLMGALYGYLVEEYNKNQAEESNKIDVDTLKAALAAPSLSNLSMLQAVFGYLENFSTSTAASTAFSSVKSNLTEILTTIRQRNNTAKILVATQYDPYQWMSASETDTLKEQIDALKAAFTAGVTALNVSIQGAVTEVNDSNISVVDVCSAFAGSQANLCNAYYNGVQGSFPSMTVDMDLDFHPNQTGHDLIAETITDALFEGLELWVGGTRVTAENAGNVLGDGKVSYNAATHTLTLNGATITAGYADYGSYYGIYAEGDLNLVLEGKNSITLAGSSGGYDYICGVYNDNGNLNITGSSASDQLTVAISGSMC